MMPTTEPEPLKKLEIENARLVALLEAHGIAWRQGSATDAPVPTHAEASRLSTAEKLALFGRLFRGRPDVYPVRWESKTTGKSGYAPACANEWRPRVCEKPRIKCAECGNRQLIPLSDTVLFKHLAGDQTIGAYPLLTDDTCHFLAVDFDEADWKEDALAFVVSCRELGVPVALEISRSGNGAHAWIFFEGRVAARDARRLGTAIISHTCARTRQLKLSSYDRLFPNQDTTPKSGFGNLIALPLQKTARERDCNVFVDDALRPHPDQWAFLASLPRMSVRDIEPIVLRATGGTHPLDVTFVEEEDLKEPWKRSASASTKLAGPLPERLTLTLSNQVYFEKAQLPQALANRLVRLAAFQNPEFYKAQAMRLPVWDKPRVIGCAENFPRHIALPRGCLEPALALLRTNGIRCDLQDERTAGEPLSIAFAGSLRCDQKGAVTAMLAHDAGVLCAPTAFGKTVVAAAIIARRGVNTLILVHRTELLRQWQERLQAFLSAGKELVGTVGGGKAKPTGRIDIAVMQIIFMQCGPTRHTVARPEGAPKDLEVVPRLWAQGIDASPDIGIQEVFRRLATDGARTEAIAEEVQRSFETGRKLLVLTERTEHLGALAAALESRIPPLFVLHGRMSPRQRAALTESLDELSPEAPRVLLSTGKLVGEGFDHPALDTLVLAMPISWKGTLQQYAGRLHRDHIDKADIRIVDFVDTGHPALLRMWEKRQNGYRAMGYRISEAPGPGTGAIQLALEA